MTTQESARQLATVLAIAVVLIVGCRSEKPASESDAQPSVLAEISSVSEKLDALVGDPDASRIALKQFADRAAKVPENELGALVGEYTAFRESLPAIAGIELSAELSAVDWLLRMRQLLAGAWSVDALVEAEELSDLVPPSLPSNIADDLLKRTADKTVEFAEVTEASESPDADILNLLIESLGQLQPNNDKSAEQLSQLVASLKSKVDVVQQNSLVEQLASEAEVLGKQMRIASQIDDPELRRSALVQLIQSVDSIRLRFALQESKVAEQTFSELRSQLDAMLSKSVDSLGEEHASKMNKARMGYQAWALGQIQQINGYLEGDKIDKVLYRLRDDSADSKEPVVVDIATFPGVRRRFEKAIGELADNFHLTSEQKAKVGEYVSDNWYPLVYQTKHDAAVRYLLPINQNLLEPPVAKFYTEAFEKTWQQIDDGKNLQLSLAKMTAKVPKRTLDSFVEVNDE